MSAAKCCCGRWVPVDTHPIDLHGRFCHERTIKELRDRAVVAEAMADRFRSALEKIAGLNYGPYGPVDDFRIIAARALSVNP